MQGGSATKGQKENREVHVCHVCLLDFINSTSLIIFAQHERTHIHAWKHMRSHKVSHTHTHTLVNSVERQVDKQRILPSIHCSPLETGCCSRQQHFAADTY